MKPDAKVNRYVFPGFIYLKTPAKKPAPYDTWRTGNTGIHLVLTEAGALKNNDANITNSK